MSGKPVFLSHLETTVGQRDRSIPITEENFSEKTGTAISWHLYFSKPQDLAVSLPSELMIYINLTVKYNNVRT